MDLIERITQMISPIAEEQGLEIVRVRMLSGRTPTLQIMAERSDGTMPIEACASFSRAISILMDVEDPISSEYRLEVSSPGIDRPLTRAKDFAKWEGFDAKIELGRPTLEGRKRFRGTLRGVSDEQVQLELDDAPDSPIVHLPVADIADAKLVLTDELIAAVVPQQDNDTTEPNAL